MINYAKNCSRVTLARAPLLRHNCRRNLSALAARGGTHEPSYPPLRRVLVGSSLRFVGRTRARAGTGRRRKNTLVRINTLLPDEHHHARQRRRRRKKSRRRRWKRSGAAAAAAAAAALLLPGDRRLGPRGRRPWNGTLLKGGQTAAAAAACRCWRHLSSRCRSSAAGPAIVTSDTDVQRMG